MTYNRTAETNAITAYVNRTLEHWTEWENKPFFSVVLWRDGFADDADFYVDIHDSFGDWTSSVLVGFLDDSSAQGEIIVSSVFARMGVQIPGVSA